jgi:hypothetical protein
MENGTLISKNHRLIYYKVPVVLRLQILHCVQNDKPKIPKPDWTDAGFFYRQEGKQGWSNRWKAELRFPKRSLL